MNDPKTLMEVFDAHPELMGERIELCDCHRLVVCPNAWMFEDDEVIECLVDSYDVCESCQ